METFWSTPARTSTPSAPQSDTTMRSEYSWHAYDGTTATTRETSTGHATGTVTTTVEDVRKLSSTTFAAFTTAWATEGYARRISRSWARWSSRSTSSSSSM